MALLPSQIQQLKNFMGYGNMTILALPYIDTAPVFEVVVQNNLDANGEALIVQYLAEVTQVELDIYNARSRYKVTELTGELKINDREHEKLLGLRDWLIDRMAETVRIPRAKLKKPGSCSEVY